MIVIRIIPLLKGGNLQEEAGMSGKNCLDGVQVLVVVSTKKQISVRTDCSP